MSKEKQELDQELIREINKAVIDIKKVENLIQQGVDVNYVTENGVTPIYLAAQKGCNEIVELLLNNNANPNIFDPEEWTPLMIATYNSYPETVKIFLRKGADVNQSDKDGCTALTFAIKNHDVELVALLSEAMIEIDQFVYKSTPLMNAVETGNIEIVKILVEEGANLDLGNKEIGKTALMFAAEKGYIEILKLFKEQGANINKSDKEGCTALMSAVKRGQTQAINALIKWGAEVNQAGLSGWTALIYAAQFGRIESLKLLIKHGANINQSDKEGYTALMCAVQQSQEQAVDTLLSLGAEVNQADQDGWTALICAAKKGHIGILKLLIKYGANINQKDVNGFNSAIYANYIKNDEIVNFLATLGVVVDMDGFKDSDIPLIYAAVTNNKTAIISLIESGIDVDQTDKIMQSTALMFVAESGNKEIVEILVNGKAQTNIINKANRTALKYAQIKLSNSTGYRKDSFDIVQLLQTLEKPASLEKGIEESKDDIKLSLVESLPMESFSRQETRVTRKRKLEEEKKEDPKEEKETAETKQRESFDKFKKEALALSKNQRQYLINILYRYGVGVIQDIQEADQWRERSLKLGYQEKGEEVEYLNMLFSESFGEDNILILKNAVEINRNAVAAYYLGLIYSLGQIVPKDVVKAAEYYQLAADQGHSMAQCYLGICYLDGKGVEKNEKKGVELHELIVNLGESFVQNSLAICYKNGEGVERDLERAMELFQLSADQGYAGALNNLGFQYEVRKNDEKAVEYYQLAADKGSNLAISNLALCYKNGEGVGRDQEKAVELLRLAADQGNPDAQDKLGFCYEYGRGVKLNQEEALRLYTLAGDKCKYKLENLQAKIQDQLLSEASSNRRQLELESDVVKSRRKIFAAGINRASKDDKTNDLNLDETDKDKNRVRFSDNPKQVVSVESYKKLNQQQNYQKT